MLEMNVISPLLHVCPMAIMSTPERDAVNALAFVGILWNGWIEDNHQVEIRLPAFTLEWKVEWNLLKRDIG